MPIVFVSPADRLILWPVTPANGSVLVPLFTWCCRSLTLIYFPRRLESILAVDFEVFGSGCLVPALLSPSCFSGSHAHFILIECFSEAPPANLPFSSVKPPSSLGLLSDPMKFGVLDQALAVARWTRSAFEVDLLPAST